jgi:quercetin 2,3-dioxygenase
MNLRQFKVFRRISAVRGVAGHSVPGNSNLLLIDLLQPLIMTRKEFIKGSAILGATIAVPSIVKASGLFNQSNDRKVYRILNSDRTKVGTLPILRAFAGDHLDYVSPYVMFDEFGPVDLRPGSEPLRVNAHPHAGVIPTTYFLSGSGHHKDSLNYDFQVSKGEFMMFSSGKGAIHMEETGQLLHDKGGTYHGFQIWLNMPAAYKWVDPTTSVFREKDMDELHTDAFDAKVVLGELMGVKSKIKLLSPAFYYHITLKPGAKMTIPTEPTHNAFIYAIEGQLELEGQRSLKANQVALYQRGASDIELFSENGAAFLVLGGQPFNEPVYSYGPFVMNTEDEIRRCIRNYQEGKMGDPDMVNN